MNRSPRIYIKTTFSVQKYGSLSTFYDIVRLFRSTSYCCFYRLFHRKHKYDPTNVLTCSKPLSTGYPGDHMNHTYDFIESDESWHASARRSSVYGGMGRTIYSQTSLKNKWTFESRQNTYWSKPSAQITLYDCFGRLLQVGWMIQCKLSRVVCVQVPMNKIFKLSTCGENKWMFGSSKYVKRWKTSVQRSPWGA